MRPLPTIAAEAGWGLGDQALSSLTNFAVTLFVARAVSTFEFGAFGITMAAYWAYLAVARSVAIGPLVIRYSGAPAVAWREATAAAVGTSTLLGIGGGAGFLLIGIAAGATLGPLFIAVGVGLPGLIVRDAYRYAFFAAGHGRSAFTNHLIWAAIMLPGLLVGARLEAPAATGPILIWAATATAAAAAACFQARLVPRPQRARRWWADHRDLSSRYGADSVITSAAAQLSLYGIAAIAGLPAVAAVRGAEVLLGPLQIVLQGVQLAAVPHGVTLRRRAPRSARTIAIVLGVALSIVAVLWGALALSIPEAVGRQLLGSTWSGAHAILIPMTFAFVALSVRTGASVGILALAAARRTLRANAMGSTAVVSGAIVGATFGATGAAWGLALMGMASAGLFWHQLNAALDEQLVAILKTAESAPIRRADGIGE